MGGNLYLGYISSDSCSSYIQKGLALWLFFTSSEVKDMNQPMLLLQSPNAFEVT